MKLAIDRLLRAQWQYQPGSPHDPNPPIDIETAGVGLAISGSLLATLGALSAVGLGGGEDADTPAPIWRAGPLTVGRLL